MRVLGTIGFHARKAALANRSMRCGMSRPAHTLPRAGAFDTTLARLLRRSVGEAVILTPKGFERILLLPTQLPRMSLNLRLYVRESGCILRAQGRSRRRYGRTREHLRDCQGYNGIGKSESELKQQADLSISVLDFCCSRQYVAPTSSARMIVIVARFSLSSRR